MPNKFADFIAVASPGLLLWALAGCTALISDPAPGSSPSAPGGPVPSGSGAAGATSTPAAGQPTPAVPGGFTVPAEQPVLLPFETRLAKLSAVVGLPVSDPVFDLLRQNATRLGAYDFANGVVPDTSWTALRISLWVQSLAPVCESPAMLSRFGALPAGLAPLIEAAYGRPMTEADAADIEAAGQGLALTPDQLTRTLCLSLLASTELVIQ